MISVIFLLAFCLSFSSNNIVHAVSDHPENVIFSKFSISEHPLYSMSQFNTVEGRRAVIMKSYFYKSKKKYYVRNMMYVPRQATYNQYPRKETTFKNLDFLFMKRVRKDSSNNENYLYFRLNYPARIFAVLHKRGLKSFNLRRGVQISGYGLDKFVKLGSEMAVRLNERRRYQKTFGKKKWKLPYYAVIVELKMDQGAVSMWLPHPSNIKVNGITMDSYTLLFAQKNVERVLSFENPPVPKSFKSFVGDIFGKRPYIRPYTDKPVPNTLCPNWLHDLYVTESRSTDEERIVTGEPKYWRTWHPSVDPVYWCYFDHEHGSYPGKYRPMFEYTAWKKPDPASITGRQLESHNGFKIFSFPVPKTSDNDRNRAVVATVHQHLSTARRFVARRHTMIFAVLDMDRNWEMEMELHFKMDFGPTQATYSNRSTLPITQKDWDIYFELRKKRIVAGRRLNVLNLSNFPSSVDKTFRVRSNGTSLFQASAGIYEQWKGTLKTCLKSRAFRNRGFLFETRDPATSMKDTKSFDLQFLRGRSTNRLLIVNRPGISVGLEHCKFDKQVNGTFYTDTSLISVKDGYGNRHVRQFIKPGFQTLFLPKGKYTYQSEWNPSMKYSKDGSGKFWDVEDAVDAELN